MSENLQEIHIRKYIFILHCVGASVAGCSVLLDRNISVDSTKSQQQKGQMEVLRRMHPYQHLPSGG